MFLAAAFLLTALSGVTFADWIQRQKVTSTPRGVGAQFGYSVAIDGNTMVVGARHDSTTAAQAGAAFVFVLTGTIWTQQAILLANDGAAGDEFGYSVAISGDTIVVGAFHDDAPQADRGSAYVFVRSGSTWTQQQKLTSGDGIGNDEFGNAVAAAGDTVVIGAHLADLPTNADAGSAYHFRRTGTVWSEVQKFVPIQGPNGPILGDRFGGSVALGGKLAIGASRDDTPFTAAGAVYVFSASGTNFIFEQKITIPNGTNGDIFGCSVAIEGNTLVGGAREDSDVIGQTAYGAAYVFEFNGTSWESQGKLKASDGSSFDRFGWSVAVSNGVIAVGAQDDDTLAGAEAGSAYVFARSGSAWTETQKLGPSDPVSGDRLGGSVALDSGNLVVGAAEKALSSPNGQGAAYYFTVRPPHVEYDFDGDAKADVSIFRPSNGQWWYQQSADNGVRAFQFGTSSDKPVPADYDGDGRNDVAIYRPSTGEWFVLRSSNQTFFSVPFGISTDRPSPGDFDGDGLADIAVFRAANGVWYINKSSGGIQITQWGSAGDVPVNNDYDGDGRSDIGIFRPADGSWWVNRSTAGIFIATFGINTDKPVPADFTGDGKTDIAIWRPANGSWYVLRSEDSSFFAAPFGTNGDVPAPADYDGDGKSDLAVFRPSGGNWFIQRSTAGIFIQQFGSTGDVPVPSAYVP